MWQATSSVANNDMFLSLGGVNVDYVINQFTGSSFYSILQTSFPFLFLYGGASTSSRRGAITIFGGKSNTGFKYFEGQFSGTNADGPTLSLSVLNGIFNTTNPITTLTLTLSNSATFSAGTTIRLYGSTN